MMKSPTRTVCLLLAIALSSTALVSFSLLPASKAHSVGNTWFTHGAVSPAARKANPAIQARASDVYGKLPLSFEANRGQIDRRVKFLSRGSGYSLFLTSTEAVMSLRKPDSANLGFVWAHLEWAMKAETDAFKREINTREKAREYINKYLP